MAISTLDEQAAPALRLAAIEERQQRLLRELEVLEERVEAALAEWGAEGAA